MARFIADYESARMLEPSHSPWRVSAFFILSTTAAATIVFPTSRASAHSICAATWKLRAPSLWISALTGHLIPWLWCFGFLSAARYNIQFWLIYKITMFWKKHHLPLAAVAMNGVKMWDILSTQRYNQPTRRLKITMCTSWLSLNHKVKHTTGFLPLRRIMLINDE